MTNYFHAFIRHRERREWLAIALDLSDVEIKRRVVRPFKRGESMFVEGSVFKQNDIESIRIVRTSIAATDAVAELARQHAKFLDDINSDPTSSIVLFDIGPNSATDLVDEYENVTDRFINVPPGTSGLLGRIWNHATSNPLVSGLLATLIAAGMLALLHRLL